jgi:predicted phosphodiesterase
MRLAVISDIHGNLPALEAVHAEIKTASPDLIVNLGDCLSGPLWPEETAQYLIAENWPTVRGNHDRALAEMPPGEMDTIDAFAYRHLTKASRDWLASLPATTSLTSEIFLCHGSPADDEVFLLEEDGGNHFFPSSEGQIRRKLGDVPAELVLCGHTHTAHRACLGPPDRPQSGQRRRAGLSRPDRDRQPACPLCNRHAPQRQMVVHPARDRL